MRGIVEEANEAYSREGKKRGENDAKDLVYSFPFFIFFFSKHVIGTKNVEHPHLENESIYSIVVRI